jgi:hypothetical protein
VSTGAKEDELSTGRVWAAGFHHVTACSRLTGVLMDAEGARRDSRWAPSTERTPTVTIPGFSIHDVSVTYLIRSCELPEDGAGSAPKHVGAAITFLIYCSLMHFIGFNPF